MSQLVQIASKRLEIYKQNCYQALLSMQTTTSVSLLPRLVLYREVYFIFNNDNNNNNNDNSNNNNDNNNNNNNSNDTFK